MLETDIFGTETKEYELAAAENTTETNRSAVSLAKSPPKCIANGNHSAKFVFQIALDQDFPKFQYFSETTRNDTELGLTEM